MQEINFYLVDAFSNLLFVFVEGVELSVDDLPARMFAGTANIAHLFFKNLTSCLLVAKNGIGPAKYLVRRNRTFVDLKSFVRFGDGSLQVAGLESDNAGRRSDRR